MADYKEMYLELFNKVTDVIEELRNVQLQMEEKFVNEENIEE
ncbi:MAG: hypothetical protein UIM24_03690 [Clostridia bacterium]|nr:hypothetical protein [Clostridia bacterium]